MFILRSHIDKEHKQFFCINYKEKNEWYNDEYKNKHDLYITSLYAFNLAKKIMKQEK